MMFNNTDDQYYPTQGSIITLLGEQGGVIWGGDYKYYRTTWRIGTTPPSQRIPCSRPG